MIGRSTVRGFAAVPFLVAAMYANVQGQEHHHRSGHLGWAHGISQVFVLGHEAVQKELALRPEQIDKVNGLMAEARAEWKQQVQALGGDHFGKRDSSGDEPQSRATESRSKFADVARNINEKFRSRLAEILEPAQQTRLREITLQAAGIRAFRDADVVRELGLTESQQQQITALSRDFAEKRSELWHEGNRGHEGDRATGSERFGKMQQLRQEELNKSIAVLNPDQQAKFATMRGKPFDLAQIHQDHGRHHARNHSQPSE